MHELPLVFFTVFGQAAAGMMLIMMISRTLDMSNAEQAKRVHLVAMVLMAVGMALGGTHMGQPLRAINMMFGLGRSPMSNEIVLSGAFFGFGALTVLMEIMNKGSEGLRKIVNAAAVVTGVLFVWSIPQVYRLTTVATWANGYTTLHMYLTALLAGGALVAAFGCVRTGAIALMLGAIASFSLMPGYLTLMGTVASELAAEQSHLWTIQSFAIIASVVLAASQMFRLKSCSHALTAGATLVLAGELAARIAFYNLHLLPM